MWEFNKATERLERLAKDDRFPAFAATGNRSIDGPLERPLAIAADLDNLVGDAVRGNVYFDADRGWVNRSNDADVDTWAYLGDYEKRAALRADPPPSTVAGRAQVVIEVGSNTAVVVSGWPTVRGLLERLGVKSMRDRRTKLMSFPAQHADDVQAALEFRNIAVELHRQDVAADDE